MLSISYCIHISHSLYKTPPPVPPLSVPPPFTYHIVYIKHWKDKYQYELPNEIHISHSLYKTPQLNI